MMSLRETLAELYATPDDIVRLEFPVNAAILARRRARGYLDTWNLREGVSIKYAEMRNLLGSTFMVHYEGRARDAAQLIQMLIGGAG